ncbi:hypothetical protein [Xanthomonas oryzae]|uniref:Uncharacterized protein n=1 Tax=Xanthomonas oryzae pv. oryzae TaxID=64187 RepID=A0AAJ5MDA8_XANOO|nr:hypothetical protein [Xanthomonas oryzae]OLI95043.1 hypothetical protein IXO222_17460 [Xanthomonas oryzae pv. oryzae]OLK26568.1 hypothetical protein IXO627_20690 [Xanthomonas oryzae pv. oryzae]QIE20652.1 hypothetical protein IXO704_017630 [Xanthomonas oryzae pv. oryzae]UXV79734.1 hypothetical protein IXO842_016555 [Xanthomonas oryzae pv. oryzae]UXW02355.1 hypothetical protein IXO792_16755 [Xanthomonas oryzae pv. oryzae]
MSHNKEIKPVCYANSRVLTEDELVEVSGGVSAHATLTGGGGGIPNPIVVQPDGDASVDFG